MSNFKTEYYSLLRRQVEDEINFLIKNGHEKEIIVNNCCFCYQTRQKTWKCNRLNELRQFHSSIMVNIAQNSERKQIGLPLPFPEPGMQNQYFEVEPKLPLMFSDI